MGPWHWNVWPWWGMLGFWLFWGLVIAAVILLIAWAAGSPRSGPTRGPRPPEAQETPEQILKRRYARGEITQEQYEQMLEDLRR
jgi:putative membrane protein